MYKERLKKIRNGVGLNQYDMAKILGISKSRYSNYETEYDIIPIKHLNAISNYFKVPFDYLFGFSDDFYSNCSADIDKLKMKERIKDFRKEYNITQVKLAEKLNVAKSTVAEYERGTNVIATPFLYDICKNYNISADYLLGKIDFNPMKKDININ